MTVAGAIEHWLSGRALEVKPATLQTYRRISRNCIIGPLLIGTPADRNSYTVHGVRPEGAYFIDTLGPTKIADLTTGEIRRWHRLLLGEVGSRTASVAKTYLRAALALAAEDFAVRPPSMPSKLGRGRPKIKRTILTPAQVGVLLRAAQDDLAVSTTLGHSSPGPDRPSSRRCCGRTSTSSAASSRSAACKSATASSSNSPRPRRERARSHYRRCCEGCC